MISNDQELATTRERLMKLERVLEDLRKTARPEEWPALSSGYRLEIERMQGEVLDYLVRDNPNAATRGAMLDARQTRARYDTAKELLDALKGKRAGKKRSRKATR
jgi:hypothetical protein